MMQMTPFDLFSMREIFSRQQIMLCFNGPISRSLIEEIGNALRNYLTAADASPGSATDVFAVYIELTQNIRHYIRAKGWSDQDADAIVVVSREDEHYVVSAGNLIDQQDGQRLLDSIAELALLDKVQLKQRYKDQLRKPREQSQASGAGLGLIDIARKSSRPVHATMRPLDDGRAFVCVSAVI
jgi:hypothetical protein